MKVFLKYWIVALLRKCSFTNTKFISVLIKREQKECQKADDNPI